MALVYSLVLFGFGVSAFANEPTNLTSSSHNRRVDALRVMVSQLTAQADAAFSDDRLTTPAADNAYDKYNAVLLIEPTNLYAKAGLKAVQQRYLELAKQALERGQLSSAGQYLNTVEQVFGRDKKGSNLRQLLREKRAAIEFEPSIEDQDVQTAKRFELSRKALRQKNEVLESLLAQISARVQRTDESILIYAPSDADGRWIYQTMKKFAPNYLIRGDIRLNAQPSVEFLAPLN